MCRNFHSHKMPKRAIEGGTPGRAERETRLRLEWPFGSGSVATRSRYGPQHVFDQFQLIKALTPQPPELAHFQELNLTSLNDNFGHQMLVTRVQLNAVFGSVVVLLDQNPTPHHSVQAIMVQLMVHEMNPLYCYHDGFDMGSCPNPCEEFVKTFRRQNLLFKPYKLWPINMSLPGLVPIGRFIRSLFDGEETDAQSKLEKLCYIDWNKLGNPDHNLDNLVSFLKHNQ